jgi:hypothetical protein
MSESTERKVILQHPLGKTDFYIKEFSSNFNFASRIVLLVIIVACPFTPVKTYCKAINIRQKRLLILVQLLLPFHQRLLITRRF